MSTMKSRMAELATGNVIATADVINGLGGGHAPSKPPKHGDDGGHNPATLPDLSVKPSLA